IGLLDAPLAEQPLIGITRGCLGREQHQAGGQPVQAVQRRQFGVAGACDQARQQSFAHIATGRRHRQEVRLVGHEQMR
ncbi:hypothetical protein EY06_15385, partial [Staphylococcus aureus]